MAQSSSGALDKLGMLQREADGDGADVDVDDSRLLEKYDFRPTSSRRLLGLRDLGLAALSVLPFVILRLTRYVFMALGINEHKWRGQPDEVELTADDKERLLYVASSLVAGTYRQAGSTPLRSSSTASLFNSLSSTAGGGTAGSASARIISDLTCILTGFQRTLAKFSLPASPQFLLDVDIRLARSLRSIAGQQRVNHLDSLKELRKVCKKACRRLVMGLDPARPDLHPGKRAVVREYVFQTLMQLSNSFPDRLVRTVQRLDDGSEIEEAVLTLSLSVGTEYLEQMGSLYEPQVRMHGPGTPWTLDP